MDSYNEQWELYKINFKSYMSSGKLLEKIKPFDEEIITNLRDLYYNSMPAVVLLLGKDFAQENCHTRAKLLAYAFKDDNYEVITANVDGLKYNPEYVTGYLSGKLKSNYKEHSYVRRLEKDGKYWIYDTSLGLKIEEDLYNAMQNPEILSVSRKEIDLRLLGLKHYNKNKIIERSYFIKDTIDAVKETVEPVREEYRDILNSELRRIENIIDSSKEIEKVANAK